MNSNELKSLYKSHTGNVSDKWSSYLDIYDELFTPYKNQEIRLLEIGIQNGGSLDVWAKYFTQAQIILGCDVNERCARIEFDDPRIQLILGDSTSQETFDKIVEKSEFYDVIIDDAAHTSENIVKNFLRYFDRLNSGGIYIVEDLSCSYWKEFDGGLFHPFSAVSFLKTLTDMVNFDHWGIPKKRTHVIKDFLKHYQVEVNENSLAGIWSVTWFDSICIIRRKNLGEPKLGRRLVVGNKEAVTTDHKQLHNTWLQEGDQSENEWALFSQEEKLRFNQLRLEEKLKHIHRSL